MAKALAEQFEIDPSVFGNARRLAAWAGLCRPEVEALSFEERLGLLVDRELTERYSRQLSPRGPHQRHSCGESVPERSPTLRSVQTHKRHLT